MKTFRNFLLHYPAFPRLILKQLGNHTFDEPADIAKTDLISSQRLKALRQFMRNSEGVLGTTIARL